MDLTFAINSLTHQFTEEYSFSMKPFILTILSPALLWHIANVLPSIVSHHGACPLYIKELLGGPGRILALSSNGILWMVLTFTLFVLCTFSSKGAIRQDELGPKF